MKRWPRGRQTLKRRLSGQPNQPCNTSAYGLLNHAKIAKLSLRAIHKSIIVFCQIATFYSFLFYEYGGASTFSLFCSFVTREYRIQNISLSLSLCMYVLKTKTYSVLTDRTNLVIRCTFNHEDMI